MRIQSREEFRLALEAREPIGIPGRPDRDDSTLRDQGDYERAVPALSMKFVEGPALADRLAAIMPGVRSSTD